MRVLTWADLPKVLRRELIEALGLEVVGTGSVQGGFSPGYKGVLHASGGGGVFVKAIHGSHPESAVELVHDERTVLAHVGDMGYPVPRCRLMLERAGWTVLVSDAVPGQSPGGSIDEAEILATFDAISELAGRAEPQLPDIATRYDGLLDYGPALLAARPELRGARPLDVANGLVAEAVAHASSGADLVHGDLRGDNVVVDPRGSAWLVDWAWGCRGHGWADAVTLVCAAGEVPAARRWQLLREHPVARCATHDQLWGFAVAIAGLYARSAALPPPPDLVGLRDWQHGQAASAADLVSAAASSRNSDE